MRPILLVILDGWGLRRARTANAIALAQPPFYQRLVAASPRATILTSGPPVGLPPGQMGNSEVGHMTLGAGRIIHQDYTRINQAIASGAFSRNPVLLNTLEAVKRSGRCLHLMGLVSDGGVHSHLTHLIALLDLTRRAGVEQVALHAFLDGRDTPPTSAARYLKAVTPHLHRRPGARLATLSGRYYAMDRDQHWGRIKAAYDALVLGRGRRARSFSEVLRAAYAEGETDEFLRPSVLVDRQDRPVATIGDGDAVIFVNFRADRARELTTALTATTFTGFPRTVRPRLAAFVCMTRYDERLDLPVVFSPQPLTNQLAQVLSEQGVRQFRIAETEKYAHVTYFFNGGHEKPFPGEERLLIPSPREVATYDQRPEMSAYELTQAVCSRIRTGRDGFILLNYANPDMVGHTGVLSAAVKAVGVVDDCLDRVVTAIRARGGTAIITADHGNLEQMVDPATGAPHTAHTTNPVPVIVVGDGVTRLRPRGTLADIAPTLLRLMALPTPEEMTGRSLVP